MTSIDVSAYSGQSGGELTPLLSASRFKPHRYLEEGVGAGLVQSWEETILASALEEDNEVFVVFQDSQIRGIVGCTNSTWESAVLGHKAAEITCLVASEEADLLEILVERALKWAQNQEIDSLLCRITSDNIKATQALENSGFRLVDTLLDYVYDPMTDPLENLRPPPLPDGAVIRPAAANDVDDLMIVARAAFSTHFGRFHQEERIDHQSATQLYEEWIRASVEGYADWVVVAEIDRRIAGYSAWKKPTPAEQKLSARVGHYSIGAVHPDFAGRGLFTSLTYRGMQLLSSFADCIEGPTHIDNHGVQKAYSRLGWHVRDTRRSFVKWIDRDDLG